jgi:NAD-dependent deacetylase
MNIPNILLVKLSTAKHVAALTGAGISAESGIKTFRDPDGLWTKYNPAELASADGFMANPELVWGWYEMRRDIVNNAQPNPGHYAIAEMEKIFEKFTLITQNVDRLHQRAGSKNVRELHGNIIDNHCFSCKKPFHGDTVLPDKQLPMCPECGGKIRPSVVWFGEMLPYEVLNAAEIAASQCDVFFSIGTAGEVYPAANLPIIARRHGAYIAEVNPNKTMISGYMDCCLNAASGVALPALLEAYKEFINIGKIT